MEVSMPMLVGIEMSPEITIDAGTGRVGGDLLGGLQAGLQNAFAQLQQQAWPRMTYFFLSAFS